MDHSPIGPLTAPESSLDPHQRIAELERTVRELRDKETLLQLVLNTIPGRVFWKDRNLRYLGANQRLAQDANYEHPDHMIGKDDYDMPWAEIAEIYRADDRHVIETNESKLNFEEPQIRGDGEIESWLITSKIPLRNASGEVIGMLGTYDDITDRKMLENERTALLERTQRMFVLSHLLTTVTDSQSLVDILAGITETPPIGITLFYIESNSQNEPEILRVAAGSLPDSELVADVRLPISAFNASQLNTLTSPDPILISDVTTHPLLDDYTNGLLSGSGTRSMALIALHQAGRPIGMMIYYWAEKREFTNNEQEIFAQLPSLVTPIVANLRSVEQLEYTLNDRAGLLDRTERLLNVSQMLTTVADTQMLLEIIHGVTEPRADSVTLNYIDYDEAGEPDTLIVVAGTDPNGQYGVSLPLKMLPGREAWMDYPTSARLISNVMTEMTLEGSSRELLIASGNHAMAMVPLFQANRWVGTITYMWNEVHEFSPIEREIFSQLPSLVTPVAANLRVTEERAALLDRTEHLFDVSQRLTTISNLDEFVEMMYNVTETPATNMTLLYIDNDAQGTPEYMTIVGGSNTGHNESGLGMSFPVKHMPLAQIWLKNTTNATLFSDILTSEGLDESTRQMLVESGNRATGVVPLYQAGRWVGILSYAWNEPRSFTIEEQELFDQLPSLVTPVVANLRVTEERAGLLARTERLFNFSQKLTTVSDTRTLVDLLYGITEQPADTMTLNYIDYNEQDQPDIFRVIEGSDASIDFRSLNIVLPLQSSTAAMMWLSRPTQATMTGNILEEAAFDEASRQLLLEGGHHAIAVVPLFQADRWIGNVTYLWENPRQFTAIEQELFDQLPSLVTPVVANLRSVEDLEVSLNERALLLDRTQRLLNFSSLLTTVADKSDLIQIMEQVTESPADLVSLLYIDNDEHGKPEFMTAVTGSNPNIQYGTRIPLNSTPAAHVWLDNPSAPALVSDIFAGEGMNEEARQVFERLRQRAMAVIPLFQANNWVGVVTYQWSEPHEFTEQERELFSQLPSLVTPVVANIRSKEQLQDSLEELEIASALARESNRLKSEFLATMSHELRTPMNAIEGFTSIMLSGMGGTQFNEASRRYLERINANSKRLLGLINDFLDLSRIESGRLKLVSIPIAPRDLAMHWRDQVSGLAQSKNLELNVHIDDALPETVYGDEENISRIAINLLGNAIKFTEQGTINMRLYLQDKETWALEVQDTGIGIPPHAREFIFDEFRQVDNSSKRQHGGSGLGLAIVQKLTRAMKGNILLKSEVGEGSTFTILLPTQLDSGISR